MLIKSIKIPKNIIISLLGGLKNNFSLKGYNYIWFFSNFGYLKKRYPIIILFKLSFNWLYLLGIKSFLVSVLSSINLILFGLLKGFLYNIKVIGVGWKSKNIISKNWLMLKLGFSHIFRVRLQLPSFRIFIQKKHIISIFGCDSQYIKNLGVSIKKFRKPCIYKTDKLKYISWLGEFPKLKSIIKDRG